MERTTFELGDVPDEGARCRDFLMAGIEPGQRVLDVGCGDGELVEALAAHGCEAVGIDVQLLRVADCRRRGLDVHVGRAEALPFSDGSFDVVVSGVALPYLDERVAIAEIHRVLRPGGYALLTGHGIGYGLRYLRGPHAKRRFYGLRMLVNTGCYDLTGRRLPGFLGDTLCQRAGRLRATYDALGLDVEKELVVGTVVGAPVFLGHRMVKRP